jgi:2-oxoglutarate ferredoxin oxidoreductase subunit alpha
MSEFMDGNEAVVRASIKAGCRFFAGYPITPASGILNGMLEMLPKFGGTAIQAEDEIASAGMCIGASMTGLKTLTATSGPGLSLYSENIGLAIMLEAPLVIVDCQRFGPATGSATSTSHGDIQFVRWSTSGGYPIIALAPTTVEEVFLFTFHAFNLAEKFRTPVFLMLDKELATLRQTVDLSTVKIPDLVGRRYSSEKEKFKPYYFENSFDVPCFLPLGADQQVRCTTSTHDEYGNITTDLAKIEKLSTHLVEKIEKFKDDIFMGEYTEPPNARILVISYGITSGSCREAISLVRSDGIPVSHLVIHSIWPAPETRILEATARVDCIIVPEMNHGQYLVEIERIVKNKRIIPINQVNTNLISPQKIANAIRIAHLGINGNED